MRINDGPFDLLRIVEKDVKVKKTIQYKNLNKIDTNTLLRLEQDRELNYYLWKIHQLFIRLPRDRSNNEYHFFLDWQLRETYRITNVALASSSPSMLPLKDKLLEFKKQLEEIPSVAEWLFHVDKIALPDVVCSGHGTWYQKDGEIDVTKTESHVIIYSGMGGKLSGTLGVDIENAQFDKGKVDILDRGNLGREKIEKGLSNYPKLFDANDSHVPDFCLVEDGQLPHPRVIEPMTGRTLFDLSSQPSRRNFFFLSTVLDKFPRRTVHWAACTGVRDNQENRSGEFLGFKWVKSDNSKHKRRKIEVDDSKENSSELNASAAFSKYATT